MLLLKLWKEDRPFALGVVFILLIYLIIHIVRLECYPLYMFGMFSKKQEALEKYTVYRVYVDNEHLDWNEYDYRYYTYLSNSIHQYDGILNNNGFHPESKVIDKFFRRLHSENSSLHESMLTPFIYHQEYFTPVYSGFLEHHFGQHSIRIERETYDWSQNQPIFLNKTIIHEVSQ